MTEVAIIAIAVAALAGLFLAYRKDTRALVEQNRVDHMQQFSALLAQNEWMSRMTEQGVLKVQDMAQQVATGRPAAAPDAPPSEYRPWSLEREAELEEEMEGTADTAPPKEQAARTLADLLNDVGPVISEDEDNG